MLKRLVEWFARSSKAVKYAKFAVPGVSPLASSAAKAKGAAKAGLMAAVVGSEFLKYLAYVKTARVIGGEKAERVVSRAYMFILGVALAFGAAWRERLLKALRENEACLFLDDVAKAGADDPLRKYIVQEIGGTNGASKAVQRLLTERANALAVSAKAAARAEKLEAALEDELAQFAAYAARYADILGQDTTVAIRSIGAMTDRGVALNLLRTRFEMARRTVAEAGSTRASPALRFEPATKRKGGGAKGLSARSANRLNGRDVPDRASPNGEERVNQVVETQAGRYSGNPPVELNVAQIPASTNGKVAVESGTVSDRLLRFYNVEPRLRKAFWRLLNNLSRDNLHGAKKLVVEGQYRFRTGDYRIFVELRSDGTYLIKDILRRGQIAGWSE